MNQTYSVLQSEKCVVLIQQRNELVPSLSLIMNDVVAIGVHIELHPVGLLR